MEAQLFASIAVESTDLCQGESLVLPPPAKAIPRTYPAVPQRDESIELRRLHQPSVQDDEASLLEEADREDGLIRTSSGGVDHGVEALQGVWNPYMNRFRLLSACLMNFMNGMNDSAPGALIPYLEKYVYRLDCEP